jgi:hypothetical protein
MLDPNNPDMRYAAFHAVLTAEALHRLSASVKLNRAFTCVRDASPV